MDLNLPISLSNTYNLSCNKVKLIQPTETVDVGEKLINADVQLSTLTNLIDNNFLELNGRINLKQNILSSYEPIDQDINQLPILHSTTQLSKITWDSDYINLYKHDDPMDERYGLLDMQLTTTFVSDVYDKYTKISTGSLLSNYYTTNQILNFSTFSNYYTNITVNNIINTLPPTISDYEPEDQDIKQISLMQSSTKLSKIAYDGAYFNMYRHNDPLDERYGLLDLKLTTTFVSDVYDKYTKITTDSLLSNYYTTNQILAITGLSNYNTKVTSNHILTSNYYTTNQILNFSTFSNYNTKVTSNHILTSNYYTRGETTSLLDAKQWALEPIGEGINLLWSGTQISKLRGVNGISVGVEFPTAEVSVGLDADYYSQTTTNTILNNMQLKLNPVGSGFGANLLWSSTQLSRIRGWNGINCGVDYPDGAVAVYLDNQSITNLTHYYTLYTVNSLLTNYFDKLQIDSLLYNYYLKSETYTKIQTLNISGLSNYYDKTTTNSLLSNYYTKSQVYTQDEVYLNYFTKDYIQNNYYDASTSDLQLTHLVYDYINNNGNKLYEKVASPGSTIKNYFYNITGSNNLNVTSNTINKTISLDINKLNISGLSNYYDKSEAPTILQEKIIDHGGSGAVLLQQTDGIVPKNHLSRIFGVAPISIAKYLESGDANKDGNVGVSINLYQDDTIKYATSLSSLVTPINGNLNILKSNGSSLAAFTDTNVTISSQLTAYNGIIGNNIYCNSVIANDIDCSTLTGNVIPWLRDGVITDSISTYSLSRLEIATKFMDYYNVSQVNGVCTNVVYDYTNSTGFRLYDKMINANQPRNYLYVITGSTNLNITRNNVLTSINCDINKLNISGLSNYYDKTTSDTNYYTKTYINTNYYDKTTVDTIINTTLNTPVIYYAGYITDTGLINQDNGYYSFTVSKTGTGIYTINFGTAMATQQYNVHVTARIASPTFTSYSSQTTTGVVIYTFNSGGTAVDTRFSFMCFI